MSESKPATVGPGFWRLMRYAALLGVTGALAAFVFLRITGLGAKWYGDPGTGWFEGPVWWVAVAAGAGLIVGIVRRALAMPAKTAGLAEDLEREEVDVRTVPSVVAVSAVSLIGGASLGPEVALGKIGGGSAGWLAKLRGLDEDDSKVLTLSGMAGTFGGLFSSPLVAMVLVLEIARAPRERLHRAFYGSLVASSVSFAVYFLIAGALFLGVYAVPSYTFEDWNLLAAVGLGIAAALLAFATMAITAATTKAFARISVPEVSKPVIGGIIFGVIGVALPLTNFTGSEQLGVVLSEADTLGLGLLVGILVGKMLAFAASAGSGFIGGPIFPILFIGGVAGVIVNDIFPGIPIGLAFTCMLAAVPGSVISAPFSMLLLAALFTQVGALQTAPILIAVGVANLTFAGMRTMVQARMERSAATPPAE